MSVSTPTQPDFTSQTASAYKTAIDGAVSVLKRFGFGFGPHEQAVPDMTVRVDAGVIHGGGDSLSAVAAQNSATIVAPTVNPRIDRVVMDRHSGTVTVVAGAEAGSPTAPAIPFGKLPICQVALTVGQTEIVNADLTDERVMGQLGRAHRDINIAEYGKLAMAGSTDDTPTWEAAQDLISTQGGANIWVPNGTTKFNLVVGASALETMVVNGFSMDHSILKKQTTAALFASPADNSRVFFRQIKMINTDSTNPVLKWTSGRLGVDECNLDGDSQASDLIQFLSQNANSALIMRSLIQNAGANSSGIVWSNANAGQAVLNRLVNNSRTGVHIKEASSVLDFVLMNIIDSNGQGTGGLAGVALTDGAADCVVALNYFEDNRPDQIRSTINRLAIIGNAFTGSGQTNDLNIAGTLAMILGNLGSAKPYTISGSLHTLIANVMGSLANTATDTMIWGCRTTAGALIDNVVPENTTFSRNVTVTQAAPATPTANTLYKETIPKVLITYSATASTITWDVNVSGIADGGTGTDTITFATAFAAANQYVVTQSGNATPSGRHGTLNTGSVVIVRENAAGAATDDTSVAVSCTGAQ